jgi:hypothetical protein
MTTLPVPERRTLSEQLADAIMPGPGIGDPLPRPHDVIASSHWADVLVCRCGVLAQADHERQEWVGDGNHVMPFGLRPVRFHPARPPEPVTPEQHADQAHERVEQARRARSGAVQTILAAMDIDVGAQDGPGGELATSQLPESASTDISAPDPAAAHQAAEERAAKDERNARDRQRRLDRRRQAERKEPGRRWRGFRPKV